MAALGSALVCPGAHCDFGTNSINADCGGEEKGNDDDRLPARPGVIVWLQAGPRKVEHLQVGVGNAICFSSCEHYRRRT